MERENNTPKKAVALFYDPTKSSAPHVVATGTHLLAEKIIATAREAGVFIKEDNDLVELLAKVPLGEAVPSGLYQTIAEILAFVYTVNNKYKDQKNRNIPG